MSVRDKEAELYAKLETQEARMKARAKESSELPPPNAKKQTKAEDRPKSESPKRVRVAKDKSAQGQQLPSSHNPEPTPTIPTAGNSSPVRTPESRRNLTKPELKSIGDFFDSNLKCKLSDAVEYAVDRAGEHAAAVSDALGRGYLGIGNLFLGLLEVAARDRGTERAGPSLPIALGEGLRMDGEKIQAAFGAHAQLQSGSPKPNRKSNIFLSSSFREVCKVALNIQRRCTPAQDNRWIAARHLVAAMLRVNAGGGQAAEELQTVGFDARIVTAALQRHLPHYASRDNAPAWKEFFASLSMNAQPEGEKRSDEPARSNSIGSKFAPARNALEPELCLDIDAYGQAIAKTFISAAEEDDFVFALYGPWGRGKTTLINLVEEHLTGKRELKPEKDYVTVDFSAWKYPTRPEVWVHLHQTMAAAAQKGDFWQKLRIGFRAGLLKNGWSPLLLGTGLLAVSRFQINVVEWLFTGLGVMGLVIVGSFIWNTTKLGKQFAQSYFATPDHASKLGLQAVIGADLKTLLKVWIRGRVTNRTAPDASQSVPEQKKEADPVEACDFSQASPRVKMALVVLFLWLTLVGVGWKVVREVAHHRPGDSAPEEMVPEPQGAVKMPLDTVSAKQEPALLAANADERSQMAPADSRGSTFSANGTLPPTTTPAAAPVDLNLSVRWKEMEMNWKGKFVPKDPSAPNTPKNGASDRQRLKEEESNSWQLIVVISLLSLVGIAGPVFAWLIALPPKRYDCVFLVVDDLDRCEPDQLLAVIESLRLFLDDEQMSRRLQVAMLVDRAILKHAVLKKARRAGLAKDGALDEDLFRNQEEKIFVASLSLPALRGDQAEKLAEKIVKRERAGQSRTQSTGSSKATPMAGGGTPNPGASDPVDPDAQAATGSDVMQGQAATGSQPSGAKGDTAMKVAEAGARTENSRETVAATVDITFTDWEQDLLVEAVNRVDPPNRLTPRKLRAFVVRYQLLRLLLSHLRYDVPTEAVITTLAMRTLGAPSESSMRLSPEILAAIDSIVGAETGAG